MLSEAIESLPASERSTANRILSNPKINNVQAANKLQALGLNATRYSVRNVRKQQNLMPDSSEKYSKKSVTKKETKKADKVPTSKPPAGTEPSLTFDGNEGVVVSKPRTEPLHGDYSVLLEEWGFSSEEFEVLDPITFKTWLGYGKDNDGELTTVQLWSYKAQIRRRRTEEELISDGVIPYPEITIKVPPLKERKSTFSKISQWEEALILPDVQIGYRQLMTPSGEVVWDTIHDEAAIDVALQIAQDLNPKTIVDLGDRLDLAAFGRFRQEPGFANTIQKTLHRAGQYDADFIATMRPGGDYVLIAGNHDERITNKLMEVGGGLAVVRPYAHNGDSWPIGSIPHMLGWTTIDADTNLHYVDGWPAGEWRFNKHLIARHGSYTGPQATKKELQVRTVSVIHGHTHHAVTVYVTEEFDGRTRRRVAHSPGCLTRIDGATPGRNSGMRADGSAQHTVEDWQQGVSIVRYERGGEERFTIEHIPIINGWALCNGGEYRARVTVTGENVTS